MVTQYTRPVHTASVAVPSPNRPAAVPFLALSTLNSQDSPALTSVQVSPTPESPAQTFLLLSRLRPQVPQHLLGNHLLSNLGHQIDLPVAPPPDPQASNLSSSVLPGSQAKSWGRPFPSAPDPSYQESLPTVPLGCIESGYFSPCPRPSGSDHRICLHWSPNLSPRLSPAPHPSFPRGQRPGRVSRPSSTSSLLAVPGPRGLCLGVFALCLLGTLFPGASRQPPQRLSLGFITVFLEPCTVL